MTSGTGRRSPSSGLSAITGGAVLVALAVSPAVSPAGRAGAQEATGGSAVPCAVPLAWRVARVDREFGLGVADATEIVAGAAALWERAAVRALFVHDPEEGFPVRLVYDERQERAEARSSGKAALELAGDSLASWRAELQARIDDHAREQTVHAERLAELDRRVEEHNALVRRWNERGVAPEEVARELSAVGAALEADRQSLAETTRSLRALGRALEEEAGRLNRAAEEHTRRLEELADAFPPESVEAGRYREAVRLENGRPVSVSREIRIYRFEGAAGLRLVVAHELGHALGLGHAEEAFAVMSAEQESGSGTSGPGSLQPADLALLGSRCPGLARGGA